MVSFNRKALKEGTKVAEKNPACYNFAHSAKKLRDLCGLIILTSQTTTRGEISEVIKQAYKTLAEFEIRATFNLITFS